MDLEQEFEKLMQESIDKVNAKYAKGELSAIESDDLIKMIAARMRPPIHEQEPEGGWEQSSWCGDTAWESSEKCW